ncbi:MAG: 4-hydroxy-3-methylbut-2-enyl diphosphate reductase [Desulfovibrionaceae bacterium]|nr:4-hydroxy-3-methylbut-2-enyl diphosphate reductase [Desulfovibrionaceae bacterium]
MLVHRAKTAGFCMGVSLALHKLDNAIRQYASHPDRRLCTLGPIIHNPQVLADYENRGVTCLKDTSTVTDRDVVVIRAHGITREVEADLHACGAAIVDATCPKVKKAQTSIARATEDGSALLLFGEADHPEVRGLVSYAHGDKFVFADLKSLQELELSPEKSWVLASQTTQDAGLFTEIRAYLESRLPRLTVLATICDATGERQKEARSIATGVEAMVVVGGRQSGNTRRLAGLAAESGIATYHVESIRELSGADFAGRRTVGLTAGASTPKALIDEAEEWLTSL